MSGEHLCEAEAPTEAAAETVGFAQRAKLGGREKPTVRTIYRMFSSLKERKNSKSGCAGTVRPLKSNNPLPEITAVG